MDDKAEACRILTRMIQDEEHGVTQYEQLKGDLTTKRDKKVVGDILRDEKKHYKKVVSLYKRLKC